MHHARVHPRRRCKTILPRLSTSHLIILAQCGLIIRMEHLAIITLRIVGAFVLACWLVEGCISVYRWGINRKIRDDRNRWQSEQARRDR